jgi:hypothetical protein
VCTRLAQSRPVAEKIINVGDLVHELEQTRFVSARQPQESNVKKTSLMSRISPLQVRGTYLSSSVS